MSFSLRMIPIHFLALFIYDVWMQALHQHVPPGVSELIFGQH